MWRPESSILYDEASSAVTVDPGRHVPRAPNVAGQTGRWRRASPHRAPSGARGWAPGAASCQCKSAWEWSWRRGPCPAGLGRHGNRVAWRGDRVTALGKLYRTQGQNLCFARSHSGMRPCPGSSKAVTAWFQRLGVGRGVHLRVLSASGGLWEHTVVVRCENTSKPVLCEYRRGVPGASVSLVSRAPRCVCLRSPRARRVRVSGSMCMAGDERVRSRCRVHSLLILRVCSFYLRRTSLVGSYYLGSRLRFE